MKLGSWLLEAAKKLGSAGIATARLDCLVLLEDATGKDRSWLLAHPDYDLQGLSLQTVKKQIERRAKHEPLAYIRGKSEFYGREFLVTADTLEPRPETETMIELLKQLVNDERGMKNEEVVIVDVGTGSGCLAITAKLEFPEVQVIATDISQACIKIAKQNAKKLDANVKFFQADLIPSLELSNKFGGHRNYLMLANLPYVPDSHMINQAAMFEPKLAIFGGPDGLDLYRRLFSQIAKLPQKPTYVLTESLPFQHEALQKIAKVRGYRLKVREDFIQVFRLVA